ncbi:MAG TPA: dihydrodipicolinate synthase family protein [Paracoccaceae bacterium]|nr:dihydrodipicolinate synthase family protein [Paracoccaceae bacterium]
MSLLTNTARGLFPVAPTPFLPDGAIDWDSLDRLMALYEGAGAEGVTILGVMGEAGKMCARELSAEESAALVARVCRATRLQVVVGITAPGFAAMAALAGVAMEAGAAGVMAAHPQGLKGDAGLVEHMATLAGMLPGVPLVLQDFPLVTGVHVPVPVILRLAETCPSIVMLKHEDWPGLSKITALRAAEAAGTRRLSILCGNGGQFLPEELARGADGAMTGFAYPEALAAIISAQAARDTERAHDIFDAILPLLRMEAQPGLGLSVRKHVLWRRGVLAHPSLRRPGGALDAASAAEVEALMARQARRLSGLGVL